MSMPKTETSANLGANLLTLASDLETLVNSLEDLENISVLLRESLENEGVLAGDKTEDWKALVFVARFPMYLSQLNTIISFLRKELDDGRSLSDRLYDFARSMKGVTLDEN